MHVIVALLAASTTAFVVPAHGPRQGIRLQASSPLEVIGKLSVFLRRVRSDEEIDISESLELIDEIYSAEIKFKILSSAT